MTKPNYLVEVRWKGGVILSWRAIKTGRFDEKYFTNLSHLFLISCREAILPILFF